MQRTLLINCTKYRKKAVCLTIFAVTVVVLKLVYYRDIPQGRLETVDSLVNDVDDSSFYPNDGKWYNFSKDYFTLLAFSAFYDDRPSLLSDPVIRIVAISERTEDRNARNITQLYCILHHDAKDIVMLMVENPRAIGHGWPPINDRRITEYLYACPTVKGMIPKAVSIVTAQNEYYPSGVPVTLPKKPDKQQDFCICVQVAYGTVDPYRMIEWLELQKILGVSLVGITVFATSNVTLKVLKHYADEGFVDLRKTNHFYPNDEEKGYFMLQLSPIFNDCIYRHMYEFRRIIIIDFDEFIMPRQHANLSALVSYLEHMLVVNNSPKVNFAFRNNYFFLNLPPDENISPYLTFLRFRNKVPVSPYGYSVKSIINPQACTHMHNHYCWGLTANFSRPGNNEGIFANTENVDPELGLNQHYKKCHFKPDECHTMFQNVTEDNIMWRVKDMLTERVRAKVKLIMGHDI